MTGGFFLLLFFYHFPLAHPCKNLSVKIRASCMHKSPVMLCKQNGLSFQGAESRGKLVFWFGGGVRVHFLAWHLHSARIAPSFQDLGWALVCAAVFVFGFGKACLRAPFFGKCSSFGRWWAHTPGRVCMPRWRLAWWQLVWRPLRTVEPAERKSTCDVLH